MELPKPSQTPYANRLEWGDVKPVHQNDGPSPVCSIAYTGKFIDVMGYFRAIMQNNEMSERAWDVTSDAINVNPANYTAWHYRRLLIEALGKDAQKELDFLVEIGGENPKNYQLWHHRRVMVEKLGKEVVANELEATSKIIKESDSKNYHAWAHRQWVIKLFGLWDNELKFVDELLELDIRNNSAWNQRWYVVSNTDGLTPEIKKREIFFALEHAKKAPHNASPWSYIRGLLCGLALDDELFNKLISDCTEMSKSEDVAPGPLSTLVEVHINRGNKGEAVALCKTLANEVDVIRNKYWEMRIGELTK